MPQVSGAEGLLEGFLGAVPHAVVVCDATGTVVQVNPLVQPLLGYAPNEIVGRSIELLVPPRMRAHHEAIRGGFVDSRGVRMLASGRELVALRKDGTEVPVMIGIATWQSPDGQRVIASLIDNTARRRAEAEADAQHRAAVEEGELAQSIINEASIGIILYDAETGKCVSANARAQQGGRTRPIFFRIP